MAALSLPGGLQFGPGPVEAPAFAFVGTLFPPLIAETILHGVFACLISFSSYLLILQGLHSLARLCMLVVTVTMFVAAEVHWVMNLSLAACALRTSCSLPVRGVLYGTWQQVVRVVAMVVNFILSDLVVVWRAWVLWDRPLHILGISALLSLGSIAAAITNIALARTEGLQSKSWLAGLVLTLLSFATNVWATGLVAYKAWFHWRSVKAHLGKGTRRTRVEKMLVLLIESGFVYCIIWIVYALGRPMLLGVVSPIIATSMTQISGIYPTIIVILVCLQRSHCGQASTFESPSSIRFTSHLHATTFPQACEEPSNPTSPRPSLHASLESVDGISISRDKWQAGPS
ncbi:hypothetical protein BV25DRAFT_1415007 [Artomyces pyxidatus]|uniref:Uncharacterized protein n=1 Tax=Artomyces pyxidatus TaxID=48021 RepID=A0ACB8TE27_9AGAM|nr:hypothetical protein BV25DRAFT_1415007 [Artomyces pyxidatus]